MLLSLKWERPSYAEPHKDRCEQEHLRELQKVSVYTCVVQGETRAAPAEKLEKKKKMDSIN